mgnify:FL=1
MKQPTFVQSLPQITKGLGMPTNVAPIVQPKLPSYGWDSNIYDLSFRHNLLPETVVEPEAHAIPENIIKRALLRRVTGKGVHHDDTVTARSIIESLKNHQPMIDLYLGGQALV